MLNDNRYRIWESKDGTIYNLEDMSILHIRNCINMIVRSLNPEENKDGKDVFDYVWVLKHGEEYIRAFYKELKSRKN